MMNTVSSNIVKRSIQLTRRLWVALLLLAAIAYLFLQREQFAQVSELFTSVSWSDIFVISAFQVILWFVQIVAWRHAVWHCASLTINTSRSIMHLSALVMGKYVPGKIWGITARGADLVTGGVKISLAAKITIYEQMAILISAAIVAAGGLLIAHGLAIPPVIILQLAFLLSASAFMVFLGGPLAIRIARYARMHSVPDISAAEIKLKSTYVSTVYQISLQATAWIIHGIIVVALAHAIGIDTTDLFWRIVSVNASATAVGFIALFAPAGIGVREATFVMLLSSSESSTSLIVLTIAARAWSVVADILLGLVGTVIGLVSVHKR